MKKFLSTLLAVLMIVSSFTVFASVNALSTTPEYDASIGAVTVASGAVIDSAAKITALADQNKVDTLLVVADGKTDLSVKISGKAAAALASKGMNVKASLVGGNLVFNSACLKEIGSKANVDFELSIDTSDGFKVSYKCDGAPMVFESVPMAYGISSDPAYNIVSSDKGNIGFSYIEALAWGYAVKEDLTAKLATAPVPEFTDVSADFWGRPNIEYATSKGYFNGTGNGKFTPNGEMTRGMVVTVLSRIDGAPDKDMTYTYTDVAKNAWYAKGVNWAYENDIVDGGDKFRPNDSITRLELMDMLYRYALKMGIECDIEGKYLNFLDADMITDEDDKKAALFCTETGIVTGYGSGVTVRLRPEKGATRTEVATMIQRFMRNAVLGGEVMSTNGKYADFITVRSDLNNLYNKMRENSAVRVTYLGGSVTVGAGATNAEANSWRALTYQWLLANSPKAVVLQNNVAIGGTGSHLGAFRTQTDVVAANPDLLFVEFAVNDNYCGTHSAGNSTLYFEQIVRQVREALPECEIIAVYVTDTYASKLADAALGSVAKAHDAVCEKYGITSINVGGALWREIRQTGTQWSDYVSDVVHPADAGYRIYADCIIEYLDMYLKGEPTYTYSATEEYGLPADYADKRNETLKLEVIQMKDKSAFDSIKGFEFTDTASGSTNLEGSIYPIDANNEFTITFEGTGLDFFLSGAGSVEYVFEYSIDGGAFKQKKVLKHDAPFKFIDGLEPGKHTFTYRNLGSTGNGDISPSQAIRAIFIHGLK